MTTKRPIMTGIAIMRQKDGSGGRFMYMAHNIIPSIRSLLPEGIKPMKKR